MSTHASLIPEFTEQLARLTSFTDTINEASLAAANNQRTAATNQQTVAQAAKSIQDLPRQYQQLQDSLRADYTRGLADQHTQLAAFQRHFEEQAIEHHETTASLQAQLATMGERLHRFQWLLLGSSVLTIILVVLMKFISLK